MLVPFASSKHSGELMCSDRRDLFVVWWLGCLHIGRSLEGTHVTLLVWSVDGAPMALVRTHALH